MIRVVLNDTAARDITFDVMTEDGSAVGKLSICIVILYLLV